MWQSSRRPLSTSEPRRRDAPRWTSRWSRPVRRLVRRPVCRLVRSLVRSPVRSLVLVRCLARHPARRSCHRRHRLVLLLLPARVRPSSHLGRPLSLRLPLLSSNGGLQSPAEGACLSTCQNTLHALDPLDLTRTCQMPPHEEQVFARQGDTALPIVSRGRPWCQRLVRMLCIPAGKRVALPRRCPGTWNRAVLMSCPPPKHLPGTRAARPGPRVPAPSTEGREEQETGTCPDPGRPRPAPHVPALGFEPCR